MNFFGIPLIRVSNSNLGDSGSRFFFLGLIGKSWTSRNPGSRDRVSKVPPELFRKRKSRKSHYPGTGIGIRKPGLIPKILKSQNFNPDIFAYGIQHTPRIYQNFRDFVYFTPTLSDGIFISLLVWVIFWIIFQSQQVPKYHQRYLYVLSLILSSSCDHKYDSSL